MRSEMVDSRNCGPPERVVSGENLRPFVEHEHDIQHVAVRCPESDRPVIHHQDHLGRGAVSVHEFAERIPDRNRQTKTRVDVGHNRQISPADDDFIRENVPQKRLRTELTAKNPENGDRVRVTHPLCSGLPDAEGVEKRFDRRQFRLGIDPARLQSPPHLVVTEIRMIDRFEHRLDLNFGETGRVDGAQLATRRLDQKRSVAQIGAGVSLPQNRELTIFATQFVGKADQAVENVIHGDHWGQGAGVETVKIGGPVYYATAAISTFNAFPDYRIRYRPSPTLKTSISTSASPLS